MTFHANVSIGDNLHEMVKPVSWEKICLLKIVCRVPSITAFKDLYLLHALMDLLDTWVDISLVHGFVTCKLHHTLRFGNLFCFFYIGLKLLHFHFICIFACFHLHCEHHALSSEKMSLHIIMEHVKAKISLCCDQS